MADQNLPAGGTDLEDALSSQQTPQLSSVQPSVHTLNSDALISVFSYLDKTTLITASLICKTWKEVIYQPHFWRDCIPTINCKTMSKDLALSFHQRGIITVRYNNDQKDTCNQEEIDKLFENLRRCQISSLILHELGLLTTVFSHLAIKLPQIKCLVLEQNEKEDVPIPFDTAEMKTLMEPLVNLEKLVVGFNRHSFSGLSVALDDSDGLYWRWVGIMTSFLPRLIDLELIHANASKFIDDVPNTLSQASNLMRLSLAQTNKGTENRGFEDGRAAMQDRSNFVIGYHADGRPWGPYISKVVVDLGLISNLYPNLRHLELTIENHSKLENPRGN